MVIYPPGFRTPNGDSVPVDNITILDTTGLYCPEPVMLLHNRIVDVAVGDCLRVIATDPSTQRDIPRFCQFLGHELVSEQVNESTFEYLIRRVEQG
ncbi:MAG: sulfurtransferase TusA [Halomonadaceae bacterium]|nr:MAG: sulfurtransferase TusA [Halomonadaceae bacterium]